ncbi:hypothetical protein [Motilimonas sp. E26]|uniref:hypothetical protein n=1 Tax=Motilimonas sp. E26 TaxID=2865674 RepID=UPI001E2875BD|nr:hypothetical protein [Motilimonas sp. E26]MCE0558397.1 hypothetical protein [Motilimonas sp. E26]
MNSDSDWGDWGEEDYTPDPYGGYTGHDEGDAINLGENLRGDESCELLAWAIEVLTHRKQGRGFNDGRFFGGGGADAGHATRNGKIDAALVNLQNAMANCDKDKNCDA